MDKKKTNDTDWWRDALGENPEKHRDTAEYKRRYAEWKERQGIAKKNNQRIYDPEPRTIEHLKQEIRDRRNNQYAAMMDENGYVKKEYQMTSREKTGIHSQNDYYQESARELESLLEELGGSLHRGNSEDQETPDKVSQINDSEILAIRMAREVVEGIDEYSEMDLQERLRLLKEWRFSWSARNEFLNWKGKALRVVIDGIEYLNYKKEEHQEPTSKESSEGESNLSKYQGDDYWETAYKYYREEKRWEDVYKRISSEMEVCGLKRRHKNFDSFKRVKSTYDKKKSTGRK